MRKIIHTTAIEFIDTDEEEKSKDKYKTKKKGSDLTDAQIKDLVFELAKRANLI